MKCALYARVSKADESQNPENQLTKLRSYAKEKGWEAYDEYIDQASGADPYRPSLDRMLRDARGNRFSIVLTTKIDRMARSTINLLSTLEKLDACGVKLECTDQSFSTNTPEGRLVITILGAMAEFERELIRDRTRAGLAVARSRGKVLGRPPNPVRTEEILRLRAEGLPLKDIGQLVGMTAQGVKQRLRRDGLQKRGMTEK